MKQLIRVRGRFWRAAVLIGMAALSFSACSVFETRPAKQMAYAEAAMQAALIANADTNPETMQIYQLARDALSRARSFYRLKNFKEARHLAMRSRRLAEEAEWKALRGASSKEGDSLVK